MRTDKFFAWIVFFAVATVVALPGCSSAPTQPIKDCFSFTQPTNQAFAACYSTIETLAETADAAADANIISSNDEKEALDQIESAFQYIVIAESIVKDGGDAQTELELVQKILLQVQKSLPAGE